MKRTKIMRILGIALILALLLAVIPATPALANYELTLVPTSGAIGATITIVGSNFGAGNQYLLYMSSQLVGVNGDLSVVTAKKTVASANLGAATTSFTTTFAIPSKFDDNTDVPSGTTYIYSCLAGVATSYTVLSSAALTVTGGSITLSPLTGPVGTAVQIVGSNFTAGATITATFNSAAVTIDSTTNTTVQANGSFISVIYVPSGATVGAGTVTVTVSGQTASATFTVTASGSLDPLSPTSGPAGTAVQIVGANFPASTTITFKFDTTTLTPTSGDTVTRSGGILISTIAIPASATAGAHTITVTVGTQTATATFTVTASGALDPISPTTGAAGTVVDISGGNFPASTAIVFKFDTSTLTPTSGDTSTRASGIFISTITVPASAAAGAHTITVTVGSQSDTATFTVTGTPTTTPPPTTTTPLDITPSDTLIIISGSGFTPTGGVIIYYDDVEKTRINANENGIIAVPLEPPTIHGEHTIKAEDMNDPDITAETTFTVESDAPDMPAPQLPLMGAKVSSPVSFDWGDVTDASLPVTYQLQVASNANFSEGSVLLDKIDLAISMYVMSEAEGLDLTSQATPYYWRVRAIDAAANASDWSGTGEFYISGPFQLPSWALYTILGIGAVLVFGIGYWLGRRTAYYY